MTSMITLRRVQLLAVLLLALPHKSMAEEGFMVVRLTVKHDGQRKPAPEHVTLSVDNHSSQIPVRNGKFEVPAGIANASEVTFIADVDGDHIRIAGISGKKFVNEDWTLVLADEDYGEDYEWLVRKAKRLDIRSSCILEFSGTGVFVPHCRIKR